MPSDIETLTIKLSDESVIRKQDDNQIKMLIIDESTERHLNDNKIIKSISDESVERNEMGSEIRIKLANEMATRAEEISVLTQKLSNESLKRVEEDNKIRLQITDLEIEIANIKKQINANQNNKEGDNKEEQEEEEQEDEEEEQEDEEKEQEDEEKEQEDEEEEQEDEEEHKEEEEHNHEDKEEPKVDPKLEIVKFELNENKELEVEIKFEGGDHVHYKVNDNEEEKIIGNKATIKLEIGINTIMIALNDKDHKVLLSETRTIEVKPDPKLEVVKFELNENNELEIEVNIEGGDHWHYQINNGNVKMVMGKLKETVKIEPGINNVIISLVDKNHNILVSENLSIELKIDENEKMRDTLFSENGVVTYPTNGYVMYGYLLLGNNEYSPEDFIAIVIDGELRGKTEIIVFGDQYAFNLSVQLKEETNEYSLYYYNKKMNKIFKVNTGTNLELKFASFSNFNTYDLNGSELKETKLSNNVNDFIPAKTYKINLN